jgi:hypothetical protein
MADAHDATRRTHALARLAELMPRLAGGDGIALFELVEEFRVPLMAAVRRGLTRLHVEPDAELVDELVMDAALVVQETAGGWRPDGGAMPWVWAEQRINARVSAVIGQHHDALGDDDTVAVAAAPFVVPHPEHEDELETLRMVAGKDPVLALLERALASATKLADRGILLAYEALKADGDPSPANTLGVEIDNTATNVRQIVSRAKGKVRRLVEADPEFAALRDLPILG